MWRLSSAASQHSEDLGLQQRANLGPPEHSALLWNMIPLTFQMGLGQINCQDKLCCPRRSQLSPGGVPTALGGCSSDESQSKRALTEQSRAPAGATGPENTAGAGLDVSQGQIQLCHLPCWPQGLSFHVLPRPSLSLGFMGPSSYKPPPHLPDIQGDPEGWSCIQSVAMAMVHDLAEDPQPPLLTLRALENPKIPKIQSPRAGQEVLPGGDRGRTARTAHRAPGTRDLGGRGGGKNGHRSNRA